MQLASKMRFISVQFVAMLNDELWHRLASHSNMLATYFAKSIGDIPYLNITRPVQTNAVFIRMPLALFYKMQRFCTFYLWNEKAEETRFMFSFKNTLEEIDIFINHLKFEVNTLV